VTGVVVVFAVGQNLEGVTGESQLLPYGAFTLHFHGFFKIVTESGLGGAGKLSSQTHVRVA